MKILIAFLTCFNLYSSEVYIELEKAVFENRSDLMTELSEQKEGGLNLGLKLDSGFIDFNPYLDMKLASFYTDSQFRYIGFEPEVGISFSAFVIYIRHYSGHVMDYKTINRFPQENSVGIRFKMEIE